MLRIRLRRVGAKKQPAYRIVVAEAGFPRDGRFLEIIGHYNPRTEPSAVSVNEERALHWLSQGAQPSDRVRQLLSLTGTTDRFERLKSGQELSALLEEAERAAEERTYPTKTRHEQQSETSSNKPKKGSRAKRAMKDIEPETEASEAPEEDTGTEADDGSDGEPESEASGEPEESTGTEADDGSDGETKNEAS